MIEVKSKITNETIHIVHRPNDVLEQRTNIIPSDNFLQLAVLSMEKGTTFRAHEHIWKDINYTQAIAQESWVVVRGSVKCSFYDIGGELLEEHILGPGDLSITLKGGHNYLILEDNTLVYEYKTGPYEGQALDKIFI